MNIGNEDEARQAVINLQDKPPMAQLRELRMTVESLELSQMYYEQKGNDKGSERAGRCIAILQARITELEA